MNNKTNIEKLIPKPLLSTFFSLLIFVCSIQLNGQNQQLTFERVTAEQGLTSNRINGIVQDQDGFIWIATNNGLNRYDGFENKQYTKIQDDTTSLSNNSVLALYCDSDNQLWILTGSRSMPTSCSARGWSRTCAG